MFITRAGTYARSSLKRSTNMRRSAASMRVGVVSSSRQTSSIALEPPPPARGDQLVRRLRPRGPGRVLVQRHVVVVMPGRQDRVDDRPLGVDLVVAGEQRRVAAHRVEDQPLGGLGG